MDACTCFSPAVEGCIARQDAAFRLGKSQFNPENASRAATMPERELAENVDFRFAQGTSASRSMSAAAATFFTAHGASRCIHRPVLPRSRIVAVSHRTAHRANN